MPCIRIEPPCVHRRESGSADASSLLQKKLRAERGIWRCLRQLIRLDETLAHYEQVQSRLRGHDLTGARVRHDVLSQIIAGQMNVAKQMIERADLKTAQSLIERVDD